jgi:hypothetical protein
MQYMLLIYSADGAWEASSEDEQKAMYAEYGKFTEDLRSSGAMVSGDELEGASAAKTVTVKDGKRLVTDGPFAETKESLGGYYVVECDTEDQAVEWASKIPAARYGKVEVRPVVQR